MGRKKGRLNTNIVNLNLIILLIIFSFLSYGQEALSQLSDYWIIENPSALVIYNNYQQRLTETDKNQIPKFSAWRIIEQDYTLSDQFTHTVKAELNQRIYFIQLSEEATLVNNASAGKIEKYKNAHVQGDTVRIVDSNELLLQSGNKEIDLTEGMLIQRLFLYNHKTYARIITLDISGWIVGDGPAHWARYVPLNLNQKREKQLVIKIDQIIKSYNTRLDNLFTYLNKRYNESRTSPQWRSEQTSTYIRFTLVPREYENQFSASQTYLIRELNDLLYGSTYQLSASNGQILITMPSR